MVDKKPEGNEEAEPKSQEVRLNLETEMTRFLLERVLSSQKDAEVAKEIAKNAMIVANEALAKVGAIEKSTHNMHIIDPFKDLDKGFTETEEQLNNKLDQAEENGMDPMGEFD